MKDWSVPWRHPELAILFNNLTKFLVVQCTVCSLMWSNLKLSQNSCTLNKTQLQIDANYLHWILKGKLRGANIRLAISLKSYSCSNWTFLVLYVICTFFMYLLFSSCIISLHLISIINFQLVSNLLVQSWIATALQRLNAFQSELPP